MGLELHLPVKEKKKIYMYILEHLGEEERRE